MRLLLVCVMILGFVGLAQAGGVSMTWTIAPPDATHGAATSFNIYSGQGTGVCSDPAVALSQVIGTATEMKFTESGILEGSLKCYEVTGVNAGGESPHSNRVIKAVPVNPPPAPVLK